MHVHVHNVGMSGMPSISWRKLSQMVSNREIHEIFLPQKLPTIYTVSEMITSVSMQAENC